MVMVPTQLFGQENVTTTISYSSETFFQEEFEKAYKLRKTGSALFWSGAGTLMAGLIVSTLGVVFAESGITNRDTGLLLNVAGLSVASGALILTIGGAASSWVGSERLTTLLETREKFYFPR